MKDDEIKVPSNWTKRLEDFLEVCRKGKPIYILPHDHPDPDAMTSAAGIQYLIKHKLNMRSRIVFGGQVERPENRSIKSYMRTRFSSIPPKLFERKITLILVDSQPGTGNNALPKGYKPAAVLDHHPLRKETKACKFYDVRPGIGALATMVNEYLKAAGLPLSRTLATAFCYAISSETQDLGREASEKDIDTYAELIKSANLRKLSRIEHSRVPREYFLTLHGAVERAFVYREIIGTMLGKVTRPDLAAQIADLLLTHERMQWSICSAAFKDRLYVSIRTTRQKARCIPIMRHILGKEGSAGGHGMIAGGYIPIQGLTGAEMEALEEEIMLRFISKLAPPGIDSLPPLRVDDDGKNGGKNSG
jgi:nanoRNase/pAp phosphatase (c-di-AMP/oligoRNAs hydrolase)